MTVFDDLTEASGKVPYRSPAQLLKQYCIDHAESLKRGVEMGILSQEKIDEALAHIDDED